MNREVIIERRFRGPSQSGNGGYSCGVVAEGVSGAVTVTLRLPPPLDRPLTLSGDSEHARLTDGENLVGEATKSTLDLEVPEPPGLDVATDASNDFAGFDAHPFPGCFVCGPDRERGDGLRIFPGRVGDTQTVAAPWTPDESLRGPDGLIDRRHVWAALDCPSYFALSSRPMALLGRLTAAIDRLPDIGEPLMVVGWPIDIDGRKSFAGSALTTGEGEV
ncbi:MAG: hypothetical protein M3N43_09885, partial [Actinomycetota bacterium]|nr:hypothetical protein [Actinomycetota bacterium]